MSAIELTDKHFILESAANVQAICQPFLSLFNLTYFDYCKIYRDGRMSILANNAYWVKHFFKKSYPAGGEVRKKGLYPWPTHLPNEAIIDARNDFNQDHGMTAIYEHKDHIEFFDFATTRSNHRILYDYLNHQDIFEKFTDYFKHVAEPIITKADQHCLLLTSLSKSKIIDNHRIHQARCLLSPNDTPVMSLTPRQLSCLQLLSDGMSMREIGEHLCVSKRTVEHYIDTIKSKLNCHNRMELFSALKKLV